MSVLFVDGFDHMAVADYGSAGQTKWELGTAAAQISLGTSRWGAGAGNYIQFAHGGGGAFGLRKSVAPSGATCIMGFAFKTTAYGATACICGIQDASTVQDILVLNTTGTCDVRRGTATVLATSTNVVFQLNVWYWVEVKFVVHPSAGSIEVRVNGTTVINVTGQNTRASANTSFNQIILDLGLSTTSTVMQYDDFFALDTAGSVNNDFIGERRVYTILPTGAGATTALAIGGTAAVATNWQSVSQTTPDGDVTYVSSATPGDIDTYAFADLPSNASSIDAVQFNHVARKDDAAVRTIAAVHRNAGGTQTAGTTSAGLTAAYFDVTAVNEVSLASGVAWTPSEINGSQFGIKIVA